MAENVSNMREYTILVLRTIWRQFQEENVVVTHDFRTFRTILAAQHAC